MNHSEFLDGDVFIETPQVKSALKQIDQLRQYGKRKGRLLIGPTGAGKSSIIERYKLDHPPEETAAGLRQRVVYVELPTRCRLKPLAETILAALGDTDPSRGTEKQMIGRILELLKEEETELLIIDEAQNVIAQKSKDATYEAANFFKTLLNQVTCAILFAGLPNTIQLVTGNRQLFRRSRPPIILSPYDWFKISDRKIFRAILREMEKAFPPEVGSCDLSAMELAARIHYASGGVLGDVHQLLYEAVMAAMDEALPAISGDLLGDAYESLAHGFTDYRRRCNPFRVESLLERWAPTALDDGVNRTKSRSGGESHLGA